MTVSPTARAAYLTTIRGMSRGIDATRTAANEAIHMMREHYPHMISLGHIVSDVRKHIKTLPDNERKELALSIVKLTTQEWIDIVNTTRRKAVGKPVIVAPDISQNLIKKAERLALTSSQEITNDRYMTTAFEALAGLQFLTGRRESELMGAGTFTPTSPPHDGRAIFEGQLKKRPGESAPFEVILLGRLTPAIINDQLDTIRAKLGTDPETPAIELNRFAAAYNTVTRRELGLKPHGLRGAYASAAWGLYGRTSGLHRPVFIQHLLGHESTSTSAHYQGINVRKGAGRPSNAQRAETNQVGRGWGDQVRAAALAS